MNLKSKIKNEILICPYCYGRITETCPDGDHLYLACQTEYSDYLNIFSIQDKIPINISKTCANCKNEIIGRTSTICEKCGIEFICINNKKQKERDF
jgi:hypothetical protein